MTALAAIVALAACSGDIGPLEEAIEVRDLQIETLQIEPPLGTQFFRDEMFINPGERIPFTLRGGRAGSNGFAVPGEDRRWRVSDSRFADIDENGVLVGRANGSFTVDVNLGDVVAPGFAVQVREAALDTITGIERAERDVLSDRLDPCLAAPYIAVGLFNDQTPRRLTDVDWRVTGGAGARRESRDDGSVLLIGTQPGEVTVRAESAGISADLSVTVDDTLRTITIGADGPLRRRVGGTLALTATGGYGPIDDVTREEDITQSVDWNVSEGTAFASVTTGSTAGGNAVDTTVRGVVSSVREGNATIRASCDAIEGLASFAAFGDSESDSQSLSFDNATAGTTEGDGGTLELSLVETRNNADGGVVRLRVTRGGENVTREVRWELVDLDAGTTNTGTGTVNVTSPRVVDLVTTGLDAGVLTPVTTGRAEVRVTLDGRSSILNVIVNP